MIFIGVFFITCFAKQGVMYSAEGVSQLFLVADAFIKFKQSIRFPF